MDDLEAAARCAAQLLDECDALVVAAGAGMGVDSGLPDFRGDQGLWRAYPALGAAGLRFSDIASPAAFRADPALAWGFYGHRLALYRACEPHDGFRLLLRWGERTEHGAFVFTSNVDGQFQKAGFAEAGVHECHGSIGRLQCSRPCTRDVWSADALAPDVDAAACRWRGPLPRCPRCGAVARPNILMFGDDAWLSGRSDAQYARLEAWLGRARRPLVVELGAGTAIPTVRHFGHYVVHACRGRLVRINPREAQVSAPHDVALPTGALHGLRAIEQALRTL